MIYDLVIVGGGAAGFYAAVHLSSICPKASIVIVEKSPRVLSKVRISGGGRCNVTHNCFDRIPLSRHYPRGEKMLKELFRTHQASDVVQWFESRGVKLKAEDDGRMFPTSDDSETIIECLVSTAIANGVKIELSKPVQKIEVNDKTFEVIATDQHYKARNVLIATGGYPQMQSYDWIQKLGMNIVSPKPSLFTFNDSDNRFKDLMGVSVPGALVRIAGSKFKIEGPLLITHWGLSGPAVIRLSAWAAEYLFEKQYTFTALVSWISDMGEENVRSFLDGYKTKNPKQKVVNHPLFSLPTRLWLRLCDLAEISDVKVWGELPAKNLNRLIEVLIRCPFAIKGKTTFKEEFVTCGGVDLNEIDLSSMQSKKIPGLYFAGEVLNIDGETGGFNFQAAWTTAFVVAQSVSKKISSPADR